MEVVTMTDTRRNSKGCVATLLGVCVAVLVGCQGEEPSADEPFGEAALAVTGNPAPAVLTREVVSGDVVHYAIELTVGVTPNARLRLHRVVRERSPGVPRSTRSSAMLMHGDFSTFTSNFVPSLVSPAAAPDHGLAVHLAKQGVDVWGFDRRWTTAAIDAPDLSDFAGMGFAAEIDDTGHALAFARTLRALTGAGSERMTLVGFSHGGQLAYEYVNVESQRPLGQRHVKNLVPIDIYARIAPADAVLRTRACGRRDDERAALAAGAVDSENITTALLGSLARSAPLDPSPIFGDPYTNESAVGAIVAQTAQFFPLTNNYHLNGGVIVDELPVALRFSQPLLIADWFAASPPHQALVESADSDALWCAEAPLPIPDHFADIHVPLFYLGAAGGIGDHGLYTTTLVGSSDVTSLVLRRLDPSAEAEDYGHADLLYADDAPALAWQPLAEWILRH
jgi:hypothetical protein